MVSQRLSNLSAVRRQHLLVEFSSLKYACPHGVFMSLTPADPSLWSGVIFVRKGPYAPAILRFQISFPAAYPSLPPLVTFSTDIFHPLITPLTTYMYTTDIHDGGTVSATDDERLPPGGFSLRRGFPRWFGRTQAAKGPAPQVWSIRTPTSTPLSHRGSPGSGGESANSTPGKSTGGTARQEAKEHITTFEVLRYIRSTFDDPKVLDGIPLEAAGNPGAWHAWRTHRINSGDLLLPVQPTKETTTFHDSLNDDEDASTSSSTGVPDGYMKLAGGRTSPNTTRKPGEWNWDGVWEVRARKGMDASVSDAMLFGKDAGDDLIRFMKLEGEELEGIKGDMLSSVESAEPQRRGIV